MAPGHAVGKRMIAMALFLGAAGWCAAQQQSPAPPSQSISASLGVFAFPAKHQSAQQQQQDEAYCFGWAKSQTGIDPMALGRQTTQAAATQGKEPAATTAGAGAGSTVRGAAGGAAIGAVAGNAGKGAAIGATVGVLRGGHKRREAERKAEEAQQQQAAAAQKTQAQVEQERATYKKAYITCMEGKGYTAK